MVNSLKITDYYEVRNKLIMVALVDKGIRNLELCTLTMENILETTMIIEGKDNKQRYLSPMLKKYMIKYERIRNHYFKDSIMKYSNYFLSIRGKPLTVEAVQRVVKIAGGKAKICEKKIHRYTKKTPNLMARRSAVVMKVNFKGMFNDESS